MTTYTAGWNMPGCLPDTDGPLPEFDTLAEAWAYLADEIARDAAEVDGAPYSQADFDILTFDAASIDRTRPGAFHLAGLEYWVHAAEPSPATTCHGCADPTQHPHAFDCQQS